MRNDNDRKTKRNSKNKKQANHQDWMEKKERQEIAKSIDSFVQIKEMLKSIPKDLWDLYLPRTLPELWTLERNIKTFKRREEMREQVIAHQIQLGLPLRPNMTQHETQVQARLSRLKKDRQGNNHHDDEWPSPE